MTTGRMLLASVLAMASLVAAATGRSPIQANEPPAMSADLGSDDAAEFAVRTTLDRSGRIVFVVSPIPVFTLTEFGQWLAASDLDLDAALNLDGGTSSGLVLRGGERTLGTDSWVGVPNVIVVEGR